MGDFERESGEGNWIVTYSDLVTLLLVFFVLLYTMTPGIDKSTFNDVISYFQSSQSVVFEKNGSIKKKDNKQLRQEWKKVKKYLKKNQFSSEVDIEQTRKGIKITLNDSLTFNSGSARILKRSEVVLERIAKAIDQGASDVQEVKVHGHTDDVPISDSSRFRSNWHLGAARAVSVVLFVKRQSKLAPKKFEASSYGEYRPVASNETAEGRRKNRRVEIFINYDQKESLNDTTQVDQQDGS